MPNQFTTVIFTRPKECATYPLRDDLLCQKVFKIKCEKDIRKIQHEIVLIIYVLSIQVKHTVFLQHTYVE